MNLSDKRPPVSTKLYDVAIIGAGAAGCMAAIRAGELRQRVALIERNSSLGKKILITGKGRCNITNVASLDTFIEKFGKQGPFLRSAFSHFSNKELMDFFESKGLKLKIERQGRVFPETDKSSSVTKVLSQSLSENRIYVLYNARLIDIIMTDSYFRLDLAENKKICAKRVILATGGASFRATGSTGDGLHIVKKLRHKITPLRPGLVPIKTKEAWVGRLQGLTLKNIRISYVAVKKRITSSTGEIVFTHFGISGPLVLDLSRDIVSLFNSQKTVNFFIDLKPAMSFEQLERRLIAEFKNSSIILSNALKLLLPRKLIPVFIELSGIEASKKTNQITRRERHTIIDLLKSLPLTISGSLPLEEAMVTSGGISTQEIDPRTMESKIIPGLYFAGEIIDGSASSGGYNLQMAFSTGYLAGDSCAKSFLT